MIGLIAIDKQQSFRRSFLGELRKNRFMQETKKYD